jgi:predicted helicase
LAALHIDYETVPPFETCQVSENLTGLEDYRVEKMRFPHFRSIVPRGKTIKKMLDCHTIKSVRQQGNLGFYILTIAGYSKHISKSNSYE